MKPAYEIVRADELRVGDVMRAGVDDYEDYRVHDISKKPEEQIVSICIRLDMKSDHRLPVAEWDHYGQYESVLRQLPPERNPDVLMRALKIAERNSVVEDAFGRTCQGPLAGDYIQQAIRELKKEREG